MRTRLPVVFSLIAFSGCFADVHRGNGNAATEVRDVDPFSGVISATSIDVELTAGEVQRVEVTCDENLLEFIETRVVDGDLVVDTERDGSWFVVLDPTVECRVRVVGVAVERAESSGSGGLLVSGDGFGALEAIACTGSGDVEVASPLDVPCFHIGSHGSGRVEVASLEADEVDIDSTGSGGVEVEEGLADVLTIGISGSGPVLARGIEATDVGAGLSGSGSGEVYAIERLEAHLSGSGGLRVWGDPADREVTETGSGRVDYAE